MKNYFKAIIITATLAFTTSLTGQILIKEDVNVNRYETPNGFFYVDDNGTYNGTYLNRIQLQDGGTLTVTGSRRGAKNVGRKVIRYNGHIVAVRIYDRNGKLVKTTEIRRLNYNAKFCSN